MPRTHLQQDFVAFMEEYTEFLERMVLDEDEKFAALISKDLARIEHSISASQANAKKLENFEAKRIALQESVGMDGMTFREMIGKAPEEMQNQLKWLFSRFERSISQIRFHNDKSMSVARDNMVDIDPETMLAAHPGAENPYEKIRKAQQDQQSGMLETKV